MKEEKSPIEKIMNKPQPIPRKVPDYMRKKRRDMVLDWRDDNDNVLL